MTSATRRLGAVLLLASGLLLGLSLRASYAQQGGKQQVGDQGEKQNGQQGDQGEQQNGQAGDQAEKQNAPPGEKGEKGKGQAKARPQQNQPPVARAKTLQGPIVGQLKGFGLKRK